MEKTMVYEDKRIAYSVHGNGKPVVLVHGFGEDSTVWRNQISFLQDNYRLIVPDLPGTGKSGLIRDMSVEGMADALAAMLDGEQIDECVMIGHSMGGYIMLAFVEKFPEKISSFGLFHSSAFADSEEKKEARRKGIEAIKEKGPAPFLQTATPKLFSPRTASEMPGLIAEQIALADNFSAEALISYYEAMMNRPDRTDLLRNTNVPVLFIMGKYDTAVPLEDGLKQCHFPGKSSIHILQQSGHMGMLEEAGLANTHLQSFLAEVQP